MSFKERKTYLKWLSYILLLIFLSLIPKLFSLHDLMLFEYGLCFAIVGLGFNLLLGYTGLLSFGHGAYFAAGAYTVGMLAKYFPKIYDLEIIIPLAMAVSLLISLLFGFLCVRHTKIFFSILALSLSMLLYALLFKFYHVTGGSDGLRIPLPDILGTSFKGVRRPVFLAGTYYYILLGMFLLSFFVMKQIITSPFGKALQAIRDNELRAELIGIPVRRYRLYAFVISGVFVGLGGTLWSFVNGHVTAELSHWVFSGEIVYMTLLGGFKSFHGPVIGAILFTYLKLYAQGHTEYWMFLVGATLIIIVLVLPGGVAGGLAILWNKLTKRSGK